MASSLPEGGRGESGEIAHRVGAEPGQSFQCLLEEGLLGGGALEPTSWVVLQHRAQVCAKTRSHEVRDPSMHHIQTGRQMRGTMRTGGGVDGARPTYQ